MMRVISSPSSSTTGLATLILVMSGPFQTAQVAGDIGEIMGEEKTVCEGILNFLGGFG